ncbi:heparinase II/III domain-containing protein [Rubritalea profundi]|uniref:Heparinase II/III-like C-terminal domain-containing protein n=1 Tax=Rubritalea profundi TaxID=1658618 RepID=A0A2S7U1F5_9BACT|nr:heparinase II/III family protein [Rubritalea profundi]PQJ28224.1 hypothetical protein BSZ32_06700 [Rubritalea profundi]
MLKNVALLCWITTAVCYGDLAEKPHPRLWMSETTEMAVRDKIENDPLAKQLHQAALVEADRIINVRTSRYDIPDGRRLLGESRHALKIIIHTAWAWRLTGEEKYRLRTIKELEAACSLVDWNPSHFLDTAEMATAVAIGYDWLYPTLTAKQKEMCQQAIIQKALVPAKIRFDRDEWWTSARNNWAQVCGSGIGIAAAAIAGDNEKLSNELFPQCVALVERCKRFYEPDGMYPEGPGYWQYGTNYHVMLIAACNELRYKMETPASLGKSGDSMMHLTSPTLLPFNFADGKARAATPSPAQSWIASHYKKSAQASDLRNRLSKALSSKMETSRTAPLTVLWLPDAPNENENLATYAFFNGEQSAAIFRSKWSSDASWFAIKGGTPEGGHGHMDVGSFCYDAHGVRWIHDLGGDDYNMPGYFSDQRFSYYRLQNRSHNTLEIGGKLQDAASEPCPIVATTSGETSASAKFDLTHAYADSAKAVTRTAEFDKSSGTARITDAITAPSGDVVWRAFTRATCDIAGNSVTLTQDGKSITLTRLSKTGIWSIEQASPPKDIENPNVGYRVITLTVPKQNRTSIDVEIRP